MPQGPARDRKRQSLALSGAALKVCFSHGWWNTSGRELYSLGKHADDSTKRFVDVNLTKKFYRERDGRIRLQPANEAMAPIYVHENDISIQGIVVGVMRRY